jgi:hypothetical protein
LEYDLFKFARFLIFHKFLKPFKAVTELGCGSCQNILMLAQLFPEKELLALDFTSASAEIASFMAQSLHRPIRGGIFDMTSPPRDFAVEPGSAILTIHAMEQIGPSKTAGLAAPLQGGPGDPL